MKINKSIKSKRTKRVNQKGNSRNKHFVRSRTRNTNSKKNRIRNKNKKLRSKKKIWKEEAYHF